MNEVNDKKCNSCKTYRIEEDFIKEGRQLKCCFKCREYSKNIYEKKKVQRNQQKKKYYQNNKDNIKEHVMNYKKTIKQDNPLHFKFSEMIHSTRTKDRNQKNFNEVEFIDYPFLYELWNNQKGICFYEDCRCEMVLTFNTHTTKLDNQISVQRLDNSLGHIKSNCVFSCFKCNVLLRKEKK